MSGVEPLGVDAVLFGVADIDEAVEFYLRCGLTLRFERPESGIALLAIGDEGSGLLLRKTTHVQPGEVWVEVTNARAVKGILEAWLDDVELVETAAGFTCRIRDPFGNRIGFSDYAKLPHASARPSVRPWSTLQ